MIAAERHHRILDILENREIVTVKRLCEELGVSNMTIRRDLLNLESRGLLTRVRGGAQQNTRAALTPNKEKDFQSRLAEHTQEKRAIGLTASQLIREGQSIFLDGSSTCLHLAANLKNFKRLTVLTDSLAVMNLLSTMPGIELIVLGGTLQADGNTIDGPLALDNIEKLSVETLFFSCSGFDAEHVYNPGMTGTNIKRALIRKVPYRVLLASSKKYGVRDFFSLCFTRDVQTVITDSRLNEDSRNTLQRAGIKLLLAEEITS